MDIQELVETGNYINEFKKEKVIFRKYPDKKLMIVKRKYGLDYSVDKPWLNYCRGLIIDYEHNKVVFIPPIKSKEILTKESFVERVDETYELADGTMINLFYFNGSWLTSTRSNIGCTNKWTQDIDFQQMFQECSQNLKYDTLNQEYTYSFVMRHKKNRITSIIDTNELVLVEIRVSYIYISGIVDCYLCKLDNDLDELPTNEGYRLLRKVEVTSNRETTVLQKGLTGYYEGQRYKWLTTEHKFIEMIKPNTNNPCLNYLVLRNSGHLTNYLKLFPEYRFHYDEYRKKVHSITQLLHQYYIAVFVKKEVDKKDIPFALKPLIYELHGLYLKDKQAISWQIVKNYIYELEPKRLQFVFNHL